MAIGSSDLMGKLRGNVLYATIAACVLVYLVLAAASMAGAGGSVESALVLSSQASELLTMPWTVLSYAFVHSDVMHLLLNMLWLYAFGRIMLGYSSQARLAGMLAGGALCGAVCFLSVYALWPSLGSASLMGASAAILAVAVATAFDVPDLPLQMWFLGTVKLKWIVVALVALFCIGLTGSAGSTAAHAGGALYGFVAVGVRKYRVRSRRATATADPQSAMRDELDTLLDRVKTSGYEALSRRDKKRLFELSYKIRQ